MEHVGVRIPPPLNIIPRRADELLSERRRITGRRQLVKVDALTDSSAIVLRSSHSKLILLLCAFLTCPYEEYFFPGVYSRCAIPDLHGTRKARHTKHIKRVSVISVSV